MTDSVMAGAFALGGALIGGLFTYLAARVGQRWAKAERDIARLCDQVAAYYELEQLYKDELAILDPRKRSPATILKDMRAKVAESGEFERPTMTSVAAGKLRREWV